MNKGVGMLECQWVKRGKQHSMNTPLSSMPLPIWEMLSSRGYGSRDLIESLYTPTLRHLTPPEKLRDIKKAAFRIVDAIYKDERIGIYADFDMDGTPALAMLNTALKDFGAQNITLYQPDRIREGYGLHSEAIKKLKAESHITLLITLDVGTTAIQAAKACKKFDIDLIITDHHLEQNEKPDAFALVNPNQKSCDSELGYLSGTGVAFYLIIQIKREIEKRSARSLSINLKSYLDCFVLGTLSDLVPLVQENRILIKYGLKIFQETRRPGLQMLMKKFGLLNRDLTSSDIVIGLVPKLNALSRMNSDLKPLDVLIEEDASKVHLMIDEIISCQEKRKDSQRVAEELVLEEIKKESQKNIYFVYSKDFHKGVIGLIATKMSSLKPAFIGHLDSTGVVHCSARLPKGHSGNLVNILNEVADLLIEYGGHAMAAGFQCSVIHIHQLIDRLDEIIRRDYPLMVPELEYDAHLRLKDLTDEFMGWLTGLEPFGTDFPLPIFKINCVYIDSIKILRGGHRKFKVSQEGKKEDILFFSPPEEIKRFKENDTVDILTEISWSYYNGSKSIQLKGCSIKESNI